MNTTRLRRAVLPIVFLALGAMLVVAPARAQGDGGAGDRRAEFDRHPGRVMQMTPEQRQFLRERREARREGGVDLPPAERREAMRQRWQELPPAERQNFVEQRRQFRQLSHEERQQLRRDILEANRGSGR